MFRMVRYSSGLRTKRRVGSGVEAKVEIQDGLVRVNGEVETRRGKKLVPGDLVEYKGNTVKIES